LKGGQEN